MKVYPRQKALQDSYRACYAILCSIGTVGPDDWAEAAIEMKRIKEQRRRQERTARIMRDPFFLQAERAAMEKKND